MDIAVDEIDRGSCSVAVEVEREDGTRLLSSVVTISISPMMTVDRGPQTSLG